VVLLPTLNEERGLERTLADIPFERIEAVGWNLRPLVIDGGSVDGTRRVAAAHGVAVYDQRSRGKGGAIQEGLELLRSLGVGYAVVLDADASYPGSAVLPSLELLRAGNDLVVGVRQPESGPPRSLRDLVHRVGNALLNFAARRFSQSSYLDVCSGFWAVDVAKACDLELVTNDFGVEAELLLKAHRRGFSVGQIPIVYRTRVGVAKLRALPDGIRILLSIIRFGRRVIQASPPTLSEAASVLRDLLLTSLINGNRDVVLVCPPAMEGEARLIADRLRRTDLSPRILVREPAPLPLARELQFRPIEALVGEPFPSSPQPPDPTEPIAGLNGAATIRLGPSGRWLYVELAPRSSTGPPVRVAPEPVADLTARSAAILGRPFRTISDLLAPIRGPIRELGNHLNSDPDLARQTFLDANGIRLDGRPVELSGSIDARGRRPGARSGSKDPSRE
jgi:hypothetical protein